jgi:aspartyl-tRNA(Asn)/glutamyl-tRNA(Gln) amidotransferase subunit C
MAILRETVIHVARLARLELTENELQSLEGDLSRIVGYIDQLAELDTSAVPETSHMAVEAAPHRADQVHTSLTTEIALAECPRTHGGGFAVPAFVDEG